MALEFDLNRDAPAAAHTDCIVVGAFADNSLTPAAQGHRRGQRRPPACAARARRRQRQDRQDRAAARPAGRHRAARAGDRPGRCRQVRRAAVPQGRRRRRPRAQDRPGRHCGVHPVAKSPVTGRDAAWNIRQAVIAADHACYRYTATLGTEQARRKSRACARCRSSATTRSRWPRARRSPPACSSRANWATCRRTSATRPTWRSRRRSSPAASTRPRAKCSTSRR